MTLNITSNSEKHSGDGQSLLKSGDTVYLYGERTYTGILIHPIERTSPPKWTVQLDRGGYEAVNTTQISALESKSQPLPQPVSYKYPEALEIPFSDTPLKPAPILKIEKTLDRLKEKIKQLENTISQLEAEQEASRQKYREIEQENQILKKDLEQAKQVIRKAKDIAPVMRLSLKRVMRLAHHACMDVQRTVGGWILKMGDKARKFRRLADIWDILSVDEFILSEIFPKDKLIAVDLIQPPKRRERPEPTQKTAFPLMRPEDVMRNRTMMMVKSG
jgi:hypothetical protein